jgi:hypothetical protein
VIEKTPNLDTRGGARRRLVKGAFAAPAMLTLQSGGASAATSLGTCLVKRNPSLATQLVSDGDDLWFRYQLYGYVHNSNGNVHGNEYWILGTELLDYKRDGMTPWLASGSYQQFDIFANALATQTFTSQPTGPSDTSYTWKKTSKWVSLRVDSGGALKGAGATGGGSAVADSCWNSFAMAPRG